MLRTLSMAAAGLALMIATVGVLAGEPTKRRITVDEIQNSEVIGWLGVPLGEIVTVKLRWEPTFKPSDTAVVTEVDGRKLDPPVEFWCNPPRPPIDEGRFNVPEFEYEHEYVLRVYETGGYSGIRDAWLREQGRPSVQSWGYAFLPELQVIRTASGETPLVKTAPVQKPAKPRITVDEIRDATVIGRLGVPLGDVVTLRIRWNSNGGGKDFDPLVISERDGQRLDPPIIFQEGMPHRTDPTSGRYVQTFLWDREYLVRAYETAGFQGLPDGFFQETGVIIQTRGFHFGERVDFLRDASGDRRDRMRTPPVQQK